MDATTQSFLQPRPFLLGGVLFEVQDNGGEVLDAIS
jgi:hypothetical protein